MRRYIGIDREGSDSVGGGREGCSAFYLELTARYCPYKKNKCWRSCYLRPHSDVNFSKFLSQIPCHNAHLFATKRSSLNSITAKATFLTWARRTPSPAALRLKGGSNSSADTALPQQTISEKNHEKLRRRYLGSPVLLHHQLVLLYMHNLLIVLTERNKSTATATVSASPSAEADLKFATEIAIRV